MGLICEMCNTEFDGDSITGLCADCLLKAEVAFARRKRQQETYNSISEAIGYGDLPANMEHYGFSHSTPEIEARNPQAWAHARGWKPSDASLWLWGAPGCGKSFLALSVARRAIWNGLSVCHVNARRLVSMLQRFEAGAESIGRWKSARVLVLDDIDKMNVSDYNMTGLWEVFDARATNGYPTIVTSNWEPGALRKTWSAAMSNPTQVTATLDRLKPCVIIEMSGASNRGEVTRLQEKTTNGSE